MKYLFMILSATLSSCAASSSVEHDCYLDVCVGDTLAEIDLSVRSRSNSTPLYYRTEERGEAFDIEPAGISDIPLEAQILVVSNSRFPIGEELVVFRINSSRIITEIRVNYTWIDT
jgi:hypothetical protein